MTQPAPSPGPDHYWLSWSDVQQLAPGAKGPYGYSELVPNSGTWIPNPGTIPANRMPQDPVDLSTIRRLPPGALGAYGDKELVPGSGTWLADSRIHSPGETFKAKAPLDINQLKHLGPGEFGPRGYSELVPGSGVWAPDPSLGNDTPHAHHSGFHKDGDGSPDSAGDKPFEADMGELEKFAKEHDDNAQQVLDWAHKDPDFAEQYLQTHGKVNYATYLKIKDFQESKALAGTAFAEQQAHTANALRNTVYITETMDQAGAAGVRNAVTEI